MQLLLDVRTLALNTGVLFVVVWVCVTLLWLSVPRVRGPGYWSAGVSVLALGLVLVALRGLIPDYVSITVAGACFLIGPALVLLGIAAFCDTPVHKRWLLALIGTQLIVRSYFTYVDPSFAVRLGTDSVTLSTLCFVGGWILWHQRTGHLGMPQYFLAAVVFFEAAFLLVRCAWRLTDQSELTLLSADLLSNITFIQLNVVAVLILFGLALLTSRKLQRNLDHLASHDPLTGALNRRAFEEAAKRELANAGRYGYPLTLLFMDLDHFKSVNDRFGHGAGDKVLVEFADDMQRQLRAGDIFARVGGEEFCVMLVNVDHDTALNLAERIRKGIVERRWEGIPVEWKLTVSIGIASTSQGLDELEALMQAGDRVMYRAKRAGRDRTMTHDPDNWMDNSELRSALATVDDSVES